MLIALAWRNLWRRPQRTLLSVISITLVSGLLVVMLSFQLGVYETMKQNTLRIFDGFAQIQPQGYTDDPAIERMIEDPQSLIREAVDGSTVTEAAPRVNAVAILANGDRSYGAAVIGVEPEHEAAVSAIASTIKQGRYLRVGDTNAAILGETLARNLGLSVGGQVTMLGSARDGTVAADVLEVVGIYRSGIPELDRSILEMPLARAQEDFAMEGGVNTIALGGPTLEGVNRALPALNARTAQRGVSVLDWTALQPALHEGIILKIASSLLFYFILIVVVAFIILNTLLMSVLERTREFGTLLAIGMRPRQIGAVVWLELIVLAALGCGIGIAIGGGVTLWLQAVGVTLPGLTDVLEQFGLPARLYPTFSPATALAGPGAILVAILLGGLVPFLRVMRLTPALAMRGAQ